MASERAGFEILIRRATGRRRLAPLLRALGFDAGGGPASSALAAAYGLDGDVGVAAVVPVGRRGELLALLIELTEADASEAMVRIARRVRAYNPAVPYLFIFAEPGYRRLVFASFGIEAELRRLVIERHRPRRTDIEALEELAAREGEGGVALALRHARALDRSRVTRQFFRDFRVQRARVAAAWEGLPAESVAEREQLGLLLLCRLMFLYFLQRRGHLAGDRAYLPGLFRRWRARPGAATFYRTVLDPLFFGALNTRPERRTPAAAALGALPYLNGGLFERHALERRFPERDLPDAVIAGVLDGLLERYRFTTREAAETAAEGAGEVGVDPEMLGRVFEELMAAERRGASGTFFTPAAVVDRLVREALEAWLAGREGLDVAGAAALVRHGDASGLAPARRRALERALGELRVLDPACGSGAFLLGALSRISRLRLSLGGGAPADVRREIVGHALHGVDVQDDAALLCALRLWLALTLDGTDTGSGTSATVPPLPNLDRRIRQGDALVDPFDLVGGAEEGEWPRVPVDAAVRRALRALPPLAARYLTADPGEKPALQAALADAERGLARAWLDALGRRLERRRAELAAEAAGRDLFGSRPARALHAERAGALLDGRLAELDAVRAALDDAGALPFFSFGVHFPEAVGGFDLILSNPPWIRAHRWPAALGRLVRRRYGVCRHAGWRRGAELAGAPGGVGAQVDLSLLFLERSLRMLTAGGVLAMLLPAKALRSLYGAGARRLLLREAALVAIEDQSLDPRAIFRADAYAAAVIARRRQPGTDPIPGHGTGFPGGGEPVRGGEPAGGGEPAHGIAAAGDATAAAPAAVGAAPAGGAVIRAISSGGREQAGASIRVTMVRRGGPALRFSVQPDELPILPGDPEAPWLLAPPDARAALRRMQARGGPLGDDTALRIRRGVVTGANDVLIIREREPKLGGLARIRAEGFFRARRAGRTVTEARRFQALVEDAVLRPLVRGSDIAAWRFRAAGHLVWIHDDVTARPRTPPPRAARYLARHTATLRARAGWRPGTPDGALFRASPATLAPKVAWRDLAPTLEAVALPPRIHHAARDVPLVPLNTVYFIPTPTDEMARLLAAFLNSLPVRTFARAIAERARNGRFRFFAWTVALVPLPADWATGPPAAALLRLSHAAHRNGKLAPRERTELDRLVAQYYGLTADDMDGLARFDAWLRGAA
ncbi:MAG TPA: DNA methyltransferase [Longimicrobiales bacterium]